MPRHESESWPKPKEISTNKFMTLVVMRNDPQGMRKIPQKPLANQGKENRNAEPLQNRTRRLRSQPREVLDIIKA